MPHKWNYTELVVNEQGSMLLKRIAIAASGGRGYVVTFSDLENDMPVEPIYWAGATHLEPVGSERLARQQAADLPSDGVWTLMGEATCRYVRLYHQATSDAPYLIRDVRPYLVNPPPREEQEPS